MRRFAFAMLLGALAAAAAGPPPRNIPIRRFATG